jgi:hypothetical protein
MNPFRRPPSGEVTPDSLRASSESRLRAAPSRANPSGQYVTRYGQIRAVLLGYLSPILVDSVLARAMHARNLTPAHLSESALAEVTADIMVGLRLFVPEERLSQLMLELAETLDQGHT